jgi:TetR/AcrR family transcriptional repressor of nem operon
MATKGELTKQKIIDDAAKIFQRKGFGATSVNDLLSVTGATKGNLYFHFSGKEAVGIAVLSRESERFMQFLDDTLSGETPADCLDNFFTMALRKHQKTGFVGGCLFGNTALEASDTSPVYAQTVFDVFDRWIGKIQSKVADAQDLGLIRGDLPAEHLAQMIVATIEGGIMQSRLQKSAAPMTRCLDTLRTVLDLKLPTAH